MRQLPVEASQIQRQKVFSTASASSWMPCDVLTLLQDTYVTAFFLPPPQPVDLIEPRACQPDGPADQVVSSMRASSAKGVRMFVS